MKRKESDASEEPQHGRRQPQTSCDFCRKKKLKCDRGDPCSSCSVRGLPCNGQPGAKKIATTSTSALSNDGVFQRLRTLEQAVFHAEGGEPAIGRQHTEIDMSFQVQRHRDQSSFGSVLNTPSPSVLDSEHYQTAKMLDSTYTQDDFSILSPFNNFTFRVAPESSPLGSRIASNAAPGQTVVWMMPRGQALAALQDYIDAAYHLLPVLHGSRVRTEINEFYDYLSTGQPIKPQQAALILSIGATSAYFWHPDSKPHSRFNSAEDAEQASAAWRKWAFDILSESLRSTKSTLEDLQAWTVLAYMIYNIDGCSYRFRWVHNTSLTIARELSLHLIDSPRNERREDQITRELKRRLWWHIASTDWMLGFMGGPVDGVYSVQPRHMNVRYPRNLNDNDIAMCDDSTTAPLNVPTQMSSFLQRIRLGEIVRTVLDSKLPGAPDADIVDYNRVLALDRLFEQAILDFPPFLKIDAPIPTNAILNLELHRAIIQLGFLSRRARLHRPFLIQSSADPRYKLSREICLQSACAVLSISISMLESSLHVDLGRRGESHKRRTNVSGGPYTHRIGSIVNHLFMACTVLALHAGMSSSEHGRADAYGDDGTTSENSVHTELAHACRVLAVLGEKSPVAAGLVRSLSGVLRRYRVQVDGSDSLERLDLTKKVDAPSTAAQPKSTDETALRVDLAVERLPDAVTGGEMGLGLDGLWDDLVMGSSEDWNQLFADLDYFCGTT